MCVCVRVRDTHASVCLRGFFWCVFFLCECVCACARHTRTPGLTPCRLPADIRKQGEILSKANVIVLHNVFQFFLEKQEAADAWVSVFAAIEPGSILVTCPPMDEQLASSCPVKQVSISSENFKETCILVCCVCARVFVRVCICVSCCFVCVCVCVHVCSCVLVCVFVFVCVFRS